MDDRVRRARMAGRTAEPDPGPAAARPVAGWRTPHRKSDGVHAFTDRVYCGTAPLFGAGRRDRRNAGRRAAYPAPGAADRPVQAAALPRRINLVQAERSGDLAARWRPYAAGGVGRGH